jgi:hypothetical protein
MMNKKSILLTIASLVAATGCGASTITEDTVATPQETATFETMTEYNASKPLLVSDITQIQDDMGAVKDATDTGSITLVKAACETLSRSATSALNDYADAPSEYMLDAFRNLVAGADACVGGEYSLASVYIKQAGASFRLATTDMNAEG